MALLLAHPVLAGPPAEPWRHWQRFDPHATRTVDHAAWAAFLGRYVRRAADGTTRVAYGEVTPADRHALESYLDQLARVPVGELARPEQMAFWINLYNALVVDLVLDHYPVDSIRRIDISPGPFARGPWRKALIQIEGQPVSLHDIEHRILRPIWRDPRVHYALNDGAVGCPNLRPEPYTGRNLDQALDRAARAFVNDPRGMRIDADGLHVSSIYIWFEEDFGGDDAGVIRHLLAYAKPETAMRLQEFEEIASDSFDWRLNDVR